MARGRAASPVRVGYIIKGVLSGELPLSTGELTNNAAIVDIYNAYKTQVDNINSTRMSNNRIMGMKSHSFYTVFRFAKKLGLVVHVRSEDMIYPPSGGPLLSIEKDNGGARVVDSRRKIYQLTSLGRNEVVPWGDLTGAFKQGWGPGIEIRPPAPPTTPVSKPVSKPVSTSIPTQASAQRPTATQRPARAGVKSKAKTFMPYKWSATPTLMRFSTLLKHLVDLSNIGVSNKDVATEMDRLSISIGDWSIDAEDSLEAAKSINNTSEITKQQRRMNIFNGMSEALENKELHEAIEMLNGLIEAETPKK